MASVVVSGATGFIGKRLVALLAARGDVVTVLSRRSDATPPPGGKTVAWDPLQPGDWFEALRSADAVVHLAGEQAVGQRWTSAVKQRIRDSRVRSTENLVQAMARAEPRPQTFICASAVGYYGAREGDDVVDESSPAGDDFLARVCAEWEAAAGSAGDLGVRVVHARIGIVLGPGGGALGEMVKPFRAFAGGPIGSGRQVVSWVSLEDAARIFLCCLDDSTIEGAVNVVAPNPVTNAELAKTLGDVLGRPAWVRAPAFALRARFGEGADPLLTGQRVSPRVLQAHGFRWQHADLRQALEAALP
ncbi:MAG: TIGR01777 family oxidoreductase [Polyangiaceae bacterium]